VTIVKGHVAGGNLKLWRIPRELAFRTKVLRPSRSIDWQIAQFAVGLCPVPQWFLILAAVLDILQKL
jgi:hypothetical protein